MKKIVLYLSLILMSNSLNGALRDLAKDPVMQGLAAACIAEKVANMVKEKSSHWATACRIAGFTSIPVLFYCNKVLKPVVERSLFSLVTILLLAFLSQNEIVKKGFKELLNIEDISKSSSLETANQRFITTTLVQILISQLM